MEDKALIDYLETLKKKAISNHPTERLKKIQRYYSGSFDERKEKNISNQRNIIRPIIDTKTTFVLDSNITTSVVPRNVPFAGPQTIRMIQDIADIQDTCLQNVHRKNNINEFKESLCKNGIKSLAAIAQISWDQEMENGLGNVSFSYISPLNFFPDPEATQIKDCNYIFVRRPMSSITLKKKYPDKIKEINNLLNQKDKDGNGMLDKLKDNIVGVFQYQNIQTANQQYIYDTHPYPYEKDSIDVWDCYFLDNSIFEPTENTATNEEELDEFKQKYPNGRILTYAGKIIFEDKPIDYEFGFPFRRFVANELENNFWGISEVEELMEIQDRINRAQRRIQELIGKYVSAIVNDPSVTDINSENEFVNAFVINVQKPGSIAQGNSPQILTNNTLSEIKSLTDFILDQEMAAQKIARINNMMVSGETDLGVKSGEMVKALNESPLTSIRQIQRRFRDFYIDISNMALTLISKYYTVQRTIRLSDGKQFAMIPTSGMSPELQEPIRIIDSESMSIVKEIKGDLSIAEFEVEIIAGSEIPRSKTQYALLTQQLASQGYFGDPNDLDVKERVLKSLDFPQWREIIKTQKDKEAEKQNLPPAPIDPLEVLKVVKPEYEQMPVEDQATLWQSLGFKAPITPSIPEKPETLGALPPQETPLTPPPV